MSQCRSLTRAVSVLLGLIVAFALLFGASAPASADPVINTKTDGMPSEIDLSWVSQDHMKNVSEDEMASFKAHVQVAWRNCATVVNDLLAKDKKFFDVMVEGTCRESPSLLKQLMDPSANAGMIRTIHFDKVDVGWLASYLAQQTPEVTSVIPDAFYEAVQGADSARVNGGGVLEQFTAAIAQAAGVPGGVVQAVANPTGAADAMLNRWKEDTSAGMAQALGSLSDGLAFDASYTSFRQAYAAAAGVGLVLLAGGSLAALVSWRRSELPASEVASRWAVALGGGFLGLLFTPALLYVVSEASSVFSDGVVSWMGTDAGTLSGSLLDPFVSMDTEHTLLGWLGVLLLILLMLVGVVMITATFAIQWLVAYLGGVGLGLLWGLAPLPGGRRRLAQAGAVVVGAIIARPLILFMLGVAMRITNQWAPSADGWSTDPSGTFYGIILSVGALIMACLAPASLVRFVPALSSRRLGSSFAGGLAGGLAGAGMGASMLAGRMMSFSPRRRLGSSGSSASGGGAGSSMTSQSVGSSRGRHAADAAAPSSRTGEGRSVEASRNQDRQGSAGVQAPGAVSAKESSMSTDAPEMSQGASRQVASSGEGGAGGERSVESSRGPVGSSGPGRVLSGADLTRGLSSGNSGHGSGTGQGSGAGKAGSAGAGRGAVSAAASVGRGVAAAGPRVVGAAGAVAGAAAAAGVRAGGAALSHGARVAQSAQVDEVE